MGRNKEKEHPVMRFLEPQDQAISPDTETTVHEKAVEQLEKGCVPAASQMWYMFPRVTSAEGIEGQSALAKKSSIKSYEEAWEYYHEVDLSNNLMDAIDAISTLKNTDLDVVFGKDAKRFMPWFQACLTLFVEIEADADVEEDHFFQDALEDFFGGTKLQSIVDILHSFPDHPDNVSEYGEDDDDEDAEEVEEEKEGGGQYSVKQELENLVDEEPMYTVNSFTASRVMDGVLLYRADWAWRRPDPSWYPATNFRNAAPLLKAFHDANVDQPGPSIRLKEWLEAYERGEIADPDEDDNTPVATSKSNTTSGAPKDKMNKVVKTKKGKLVRRTPLGKAK